MHSWPDCFHMVEVLFRYLGTMKYRYHIEAGMSDPPTRSIWPLVCCSTEMKRAEPTQIPDYYSSGCTRATANCTPLYRVLLSCAAEHLRCPAPRTRGQSRTVGRNVQYQIHVTAPCPPTFSLYSTWYPGGLMGTAMGSTIIMYSTVL